jgi:hypothetical protein
MNRSYIFEVMSDKPLVYNICTYAVSSSHEEKKIGNI